VTKATTARPASETPAQALGEVTLDAINAGLATGRIGFRQAAAALAQALAHSPDISCRAAATTAWRTPASA
jgi:hypothetical protein